jgi:lipopolysaccharide transport system ATP-binding protein
VERYIDTPVKRYSSGMMVRLGFAVAAHLEPEILVVDEVLAVGDAEFQKKAIGKMKDVSKNDGRTVLFVSHNMAAITQLCTDCIVLQNGNISFKGDPSYAIRNYLFNNTSKGYYLANIGEKFIEKDAYFEEIYLVDDQGKARTEYFYNETIYILFKLKINRNKAKYSVFCTFLDDELNRIFSAESDDLDNQMKLKIEPKFLTRGEYSLHAFIHIPQIKQEDIAFNICQFTIIDNGSKFSQHGNYDYGSVFGQCKWLKN